MKTALIGYTGFVWSNLDSQFSFTHKYNSQNISSIRWEDFDLVVCAWVRAVKWWANQNPTEDLAQIQDLIDDLSTITTKRFILISTVDVYPSPIHVDEDFDFSSIAPDEWHAYGRNRYFLEQYIQNQFSESHVIRLPGLFGNGLKKNVIFDLLTDNMLDKIIPNNAYQYYFLGNLWADIQKVVEHNIPVINFNSEPIMTSEIVELFFPEKKIGFPTETPALYDYYTKYAHIFDKIWKYVYSKKDITIFLTKFISTQL